MYFWPKTLNVVPSWTQHTLSARNLSYVTFLDVAKVSSHVMIVAVSQAFIIVMEYLIVTPGTKN